MVINSNIFGMNTLNRSELQKTWFWSLCLYSKSSSQRTRFEIDDDWGKLKPAIPKSVRELTEARELANKVKRTESANSKHLEKIAMLEAENRRLKVQLMEIENFKTAKSSFLEKVEFLK